MSIDNATPEEWDEARRVTLEKYVRRIIEDEELDYANQFTLKNCLQVGGTHYEDMDLEPIEMCYQRYGYYGVKAALHTKVDKYLTREKDDELEDLEKAKSCIDILIKYHHVKEGRFK